MLDLVDGVDRTTLLNRAQALGYDLDRPHRVALVHAPGVGDETGAFFEAVGRAARTARVGSLLASRRHDVIVLVDNEVPWDRFLVSVVTERHGGRCRIGVGGQCQAVEEFPHSCREAELALRIQRASGGPEQPPSSTTWASTRCAGQRARHRGHGALKYRLRRIREVSGHDLGLPDVQFNLQVATRAWRTLRMLPKT